MEYISLKLCPICGEVPERITQDLGRPGGRGYPGHTSYQYKCECCKLVKGGDITNIYCSTEVALYRAKETWNAEVERIQLLLDNRYVRRTLIENNVI